MRASSGRPLQWGLLVAAVTALAAVLRLYRLDLIDVRFDQAFPLQYAQDIVDGRWWPVQPHGSVAAHPAMFLYVLAVPYLVTRHFESIVVFRALLDVAAVPLTWWIGTRFANPRVGLIAALLFAVAPWTVKFARDLGVVVLPVGLGLALLGVLEAAQRRNAWGWALAGWGMALVLGAHMSGVYAVPAVAVGLWFGRRSFRWRSALIGAAPLVFVFANYLAFDASQGFSSVRAYLAPSPESGGPADVLRLAAMIASGANLSDLTGAAFAAWSAQTPAVHARLADVMWAMVWLGGAGAAVAAASGLARDPGGRAWQAPLVLLLWFTLPIAALAVSGRAPVVHYLLVILPAPFLLAAGVVDAGLTAFEERLARPAGRAASAAALILLGSLAFSQAAQNVAFAQFVDTHDTTGGHGLPVRGALHARDAAVSAGARDAGVIAVIKDFPTPWNEQAAILRGVLADVPHRFLNSDSDGFVFRPGVTHYIVAPGAEAMLDRILAFAPAGGAYTSTIDSQAGNPARYVYVRLASQAEMAGFAPAPPADFENGLRLVSARIAERRPGVLGVDTLFQVMRTPAEGVNYHWYNHVFAGADRIGQRDGSGVHPASWREGDWLLHTFDVDLQERAAAVNRRVRIGSYTYPDVKAVMATVPGRPPEGGVDIPVP